MNPTPMNTEEDIGARREARERTWKRGAELREVIEQLYRAGVNRHRIHVITGYHRSEVYKTTKDIPASEIEPLPEARMAALIERAEQVADQWRAARQQWGAASPGVKEAILQMYEGGETNLSKIARETETSWTTVQRTLIDAGLIRSDAAVEHLPEL